ncbi:centrosomal protein of 72 kDa isoform X8 [Bubalus bubalis]|uniref:centrosomal protein of 72 kDa isoform X8 n=1 Tax=Bubalus bubalis TaxID=89462 RepID=UPI001D1116EE|nr:centrosomal protein of 72 kDa isoform X8 [Bubalus bubalis]
MAPGGRVVLCEEKIREKSGLAPPCDLAELRSLSIPGTYQEKITHLGNSLMNLTSLKSLDLSRNSLVSLEGIECLTALESLNLYYNRISSLAEVFRLHSLAGLLDVDLRLNPVVKSESDYRLFVVHMLPGLQQLDDRPVRESERRASRLHFGSEESLDSEQSFPSVFREERPHHSRVKCTDSSAKKCLVMDADDEAVLSLIAECEWDLSNPPGGMSSSQKESEASLQTSQAESRHRLSPQSVQHQCGDSLWKGPERRRSSSRAGCVEPRLQDQHCGELPPQRFTPDSTETEDSGASSQKSSVSTQKMLNPLPAPEKYRKRRMPGGRFQAPADEACLSCLEGSLSVSRRGSSEGWGQAASSLSATPGPEQPRPPSASEDYLRQHLDRSLEESSSLKSLLLSMKKDVRTADAPSALNLQISAPWSAPTSACCRSWTRCGRNTRRRWSSCTGATRSSRRPWHCSLAAPETRGPPPRRAPCEPLFAVFRAQNILKRQVHPHPSRVSPSNVYFFINCLEVKKMLHFSA